MTAMASVTAAEWLERAALVSPRNELFIDGAFVPAASGQTFDDITGRDGSIITRVAKGGAEDVDRAVAAARRSFDDGRWADQSPANRKRVLLRLAELIRANRDELALLESLDVGKPIRDTRVEVEKVAEMFEYYAGWCDKFHHIAGTVNSVAGPYFNFTTPEPTGVVGIVAPGTPGLLGLVSRLAPALVSGNTTIVLTGEASPFTAVSMSEVVATSDVPGGVVNILTGATHDLLPWLLGHRDVNAVDLTGAPPDLQASVIAEAADNVKRLIRGEPDDQSPYVIADFCEMKTVWHPIGQ